MSDWLVLLAFVGPAVMLAIDEETRRYELLAEPGVLAHVIGGAIGVGIAWAVAKRLRGDDTRPGPLLPAGVVLLLMLYAGYGAAAVNVVFRYGVTLGSDLVVQENRQFVIEGASTLTTRNFSRHIYLAGPDHRWGQVTQEASPLVHAHYAMARNQHLDCISLDVLRGRFGSLLVREQTVGQEMVTPACKGKSDRPPDTTSG